MQCALVHFNSIYFLVSLIICKLIINYILIGFSISECPPADDGMERFSCPSPDRMGRYRCIDDHVLCDGFIDCPKAEDEDRMSCMFYKTVSWFLLCFQSLIFMNFTYLHFYLDQSTSWCPCRCPSSVGKRKILDE